MHYLVLGLGKTGYSCVGYLVANGYTVSVADDNNKPLLLNDLANRYPNVACYLGLLDAALLSKVDCLIVSPGIIPDHVLVKAAIKAKLPIKTDLDLFAAATTSRYILVTGTNGKSTVVTLLGKMLTRFGYKVKVGGNIGVPILDCLDANLDWVVIEVSSFALYYSNDLAAAAGVVLNISADHLDWHGDMSAYIQAKLKVYNYSKVGLYNYDDPKLLPECSSELDLGFAEIKPAAWRALPNGDISYYDKVVIKSLDYSSHLAGMQVNTMVACALAKIAGVDELAMAQASGDFNGLKHRCQVVRSKQGLLWINDSKATNLHAVLAAVAATKNAYNSEIILILAGILKDEAWDQGLIILAKQLKQVVLVGGVGQKLASMCRQYELLYSEVEDLSAAVVLAESKLGGQGVVLFSPGGASFDAFDDFQHRGRVFESLVKHLR